jgi:hypothetical protein
MQTHQLTLGRNIWRNVDAVSVESAIKTISHFLEKYECYSFSVFEGKGYWQGIPENILRFEVFGITDSQAKELAARLAREYTQEAVMLLSINSRPKFIRGDM